MKNLENCPEEILDLIYHIPYDALHQEKKILVLNFISKEDYDLYHESFKALKFTNKENSTQEIPAIFHTAFEQKEKSNATIIHIKAWQLAAGFILIGFLWIWSLQLNKSKEPISLVQKDTIYLSQAPEKVTLKVFDTIYIKQPLKVVKEKQVQKSDALLQENPSSIETYQLNQLNAIRNKRKNKSIKEDSLFKTFEFVRI